MDRYDLLRVLYATCVLVTAGMTLRWGGRSERAGIAIVVIASVLTALVEGFVLGLVGYNHALAVAILGLAITIALAVYVSRRRFSPTLHVVR